LRSEALKVKPGFVIVYGEPLRPTVVGFGGVEVEPSWVPRGIAVNWAGLVPEGEEREEILAALRRAPEDAVIVSDDEQRERVLIALLAMARGEDPVEAARKAGRPLSGREVRALGLSEFEYATEPLEVEEVKVASGFVVDTCALATSSAHTKDTGAHAKSTLASIVRGVLEEVKRANPWLKDRWDHYVVEDEYGGVYIYGVGGDYEITDEGSYYAHVLPDGDVIETATVEPFLRRWLQREVNLLKLLHEIGIAPEDWQGGYEVYGVSVEPDGYYLGGRKLTESEAADHVIMTWYAEEYGGR